MRCASEFPKRAINLLCEFVSRRTLQAIGLLALLFAGAGCDRITVRAKAPDPSTTNIDVGPAAMLFDTAEAKEQRQLKTQASKLLFARDFAQLDKIADELRRSKATYADGYWKLGAFYEGFAELPEEASESRWTNMIAHLKLWVKARPESITARTGLGRALTGYAWKARGSGWASTVTPTGWKLFRARLAESREALLSATNISATCPLWFTGVLMVGLGEGWPSEIYDKIFAAGTNHVGRYAPLYFVKCYRLLPRWHGAEGEWEQFAEDAANEVGGEEGDILYARITWDMHNNRVYGNIFKQSKASWARAKRGFVALQKRYPDCMAVTSEFCYLAGMGGDRALMKSLFTKLNGKVDQTVWLEKKRFVEDRQWAFAR
jgi:hypothetical protein